MLPFTVELSCTAAIRECSLCVLYKMFMFAADVGKDWRPSMNVESIIVSIISMLGSAKAKKLPVDNAMHSEYNAPGQQQINWNYHDNKC